ncbi:polysaccharide biosynthesis/export family protein [Trinickia acidisoli]|uniref:polysaccharide biosynthesis/export family protein n=1 Tax=Trinickia acidisoli TaxID=2767482 RepID=UPI001F5DFBC3|nr:SLBB domain-containing protein [Trinickia acidisoli]
MAGMSAYAQDAGTVDLPPLPPSLQCNAQSGQGNCDAAASSVAASIRTQGLGRSSLNSPRLLGASAASSDPASSALGSKSAESEASERDARRGVAQIDPPTALQKFVTRTTGRILPIFGQNLFTRGAGQAYAPVQDVPAPADYVIGPGDEIVLSLWGGVDGQLRLTVDRDGQIAIPKIGTVTVAGVKAAALNSVLKGAVGRVYTHFGANATLDRLHSVQVYVVGRARHPGAYTVSGLSTLVNALFESGGPAPNGSMRRIELRRDGALVTTLDLYDFITQGKAAGDVHLEQGDVIVIPPAGPRVALLGALDTPAIYELKSNDESLQQLLKYAGGVNALTGRSKVLIERIDPTQARAPRTVEELKLDAAGLASTVKDGDVITLFDISPQFANAVTLRGNVAAPLRYPYKPGMTLADLLPDPDALLTPDYFTRKNILVQYDRPERSGQYQQGAQSGQNGQSGQDGQDGQDGQSGQLLDRTKAEVKNLVDEPDWNYAVIERLNHNDLRTQLIPFNLGDVVLKKDPKANLPLEPGDVVTIFGTKDMRLPLADETRLVRVDGEVRAAGIYELRPGDTLQTVLRRAGGTTPQAYLYGLELTREQTRKDQQRNLDAALARAERQAGSQLAAALANVPDGDKAVQDQIVDAQQSELQTLHSLKPNGRVSLDLPTSVDRVAELPDVPLEGGDAVYVPPMPSYVMVVGAVDNENAQLWGPGRTVGDALRAAGVQQDVADSSGAFVLRADGSVLRKNSTTWFHSFNATPLMPGDTVVMPEKLDRRSTMTKVVAGLKDWTQVLANFGLGAAAIKVLR